jgi:hypothetical protein
MPLHGRGSVDLSHVLLFLFRASPAKKKRVEVLDELVKLPGLLDPREKWVAVNVTSKEDGYYVIDNVEFGVSPPQ